jgi:hypothetical protein
MDSSLLPVLLFATVLLPLTMGFTVSFWLVGKGNRLFWIVPSILAWLGTKSLIFFLMPHRLSLFTMVSEWFVACVMVAFALLIKRLRLAPVAHSVANLEH